MKLGTVRLSTAIGPIERVCTYRDGNHLIDLTSARQALLERTLPLSTARRLAEVQVPPDMAYLLGHGPAGLDWAREAEAFIVSSGVEHTGDGARTAYSIEDVTALAPVPRPPGISCFATWPEHLAGSASKGFPVEFPAAGSGVIPYYKANVTAVSPPWSALKPPSYDSSVDVECEMAAFVLGDVANLSVDEAAQAIAGYCVFNDVSARTKQAAEMRAGLGPTKGKDFDGANIFGPWLVTADEVDKPHELEMSLSVNGERWSERNTSGMHWSFAELLSYISQDQHVRAGHILTSGCYPGGSALDLGRELHDQDQVTVAIEKLGELAGCVIIPGSLTK